MTLPVPCTIAGERSFSFWRGRMECRLSYPGASRTRVARPMLAHAGRTAPELTTPNDADSRRAAPVRACEP